MNIITDTLARKLDFLFIRMRALFQEEEDADKLK